VRGAALHRRGGPELGIPEDGKRPVIPAKLGLSATDLLAEDSASTVEVHGFG